MDVAGDPPGGLEPGGLVLDAAGAPWSPRYGDVYASRDGAWGQARHVFLAGNGLPQRWGGRRQFVIAETGFGLGTNFLAAWTAWRDDPRRPQRLHFVSVERHPLPAAALAEHAARGLEVRARELALAWPAPLPGVHRLLFEQGQVVLTLALGDARALVPELVLGADAYFLDGFAPQRNPALWEPTLLKALLRSARPGATLATWTTARAVREALAAAGFELELRAGYGHKREMLCGRFAPRWTLRRHEPPAAPAAASQAVVVGAGLAGCACAHALALRGWQVTLIEAAPGPARGASALPAGLLHPMPSLDDNIAARLTRAGFLQARRQQDALDPGGRGAAWLDCGVFQQAADEEEARLLQELLARHGWPAAHMDWREPLAAADATGLPPRRGGLWYGDGRVVATPRWCAALLAAAGDRLQARYGVRALALAREDGGWRVRTDAGDLVAPVVVVANALAAPALLGARESPVAPVRGRITRLAAGELAGLRAGITGDGYLLPAAFGAPAAAGASYETPLPGEAAPGELDEALVHEANLARLRRLLAEAPAATAAGVFDGIRCVARDRLPLAGAVADEAAAWAQRGRLRGAHLEDLPRRPGLFALFALGTRGLALAGLLGELVAARIEGEPLPVERALAAAVDPARFLLRRLR